MKTILVGTDFTPSSFNACKYAAMIARLTDCKLVLFNLFEVPVAHSNSGLFFISYKSVKEGSEEKMSELEKELRKLFPRLKITRLLATGSFKSEIENFVNSHQVKAVVLGLAAKTRLSKFIYGSHVTDIAGKLDSPVIIVPEKYKEHKLRTVLLGVDSVEKLSHLALTLFKSMIKDTRAKLKVLHVRTGDEIFTPLPLSFGLDGMECKVDNTFAADIQGGINRYVIKNNCDMITVISRRHSVFYDFFSEGLTKKIAFVSKVPVMAIHE